MFADLDRPPLSAGALRAGLLRHSALWTELTVVRSTGSTNTDLLTRARPDQLQGAVLIAEHQTSGHGRHGRSWQSPPQAGLHVSVLLRPPPSVPRERWGWISLLAGVALTDALGPLAEQPVALKWPNDVLIGEAGDEKKVAGILAEATADAVVLGFGINVTTRSEELPVPTATSLACAGGRCTDRAPILLAALRALEQRYLGWVGAGGDPVAGDLRADYRAVCGSLHRQVTVELPDSSTFTGKAVDVDGEGRLVVRAPGGQRRALAAGDVTHLR